ncbi:MAG: hypothetical protein ACRDTF_17860 [Pseudonocardiaceae bacterium]
MVLPETAERIAVVVLLQFTSLAYSFDPVKPELSATPLFTAVT